MTFLGCMARNFKGPLVRIDGTLTAEKYRNIMEQDMLPAARANMLPGWEFQQDNDPKHTSKLLMGNMRKLPDGRKMRLPGWFSLNGVRVMKWPAYSPDINPIEHMWSMVKRKLSGRRFHTRNELWLAVQQAWNAIEPEKVSKLVDSMPSRIRAVILARGGQTKY
jgi:hypothetical protein